MLYIELAAGLIRAHREHHVQVEGVAPVGAYPTSHKSVVAAAFAQHPRGAADQTLGDARDRVRQSLPYRLAGSRLRHLVRPACIKNALHAVGGSIQDRVIEISPVPPSP